MGGHCRGAGCGPVDRYRSVVRTQLGMEQEPLARAFHGTVGFSELLVYTVFYTHYCRPAEDSGRLCWGKPAEA